MGLESVRERTVIESKLAQLLAPFWGLRGRTAVTAAARIVGLELRPAVGESWGIKGRRTLGALRQAFRGRAARDRELEAAKQRKLEFADRGTQSGAARQR